jgi:hypothetical protein
MPDVDLGTVTPLDRVEGEDDAERSAVLRLADEARRYLAGHSWIGSIRETHYGTGFDDKVGVFLFRIDPAERDIPEWIWVVAGDLPPLYIGSDDASTPTAALDGYVGAMESWIDAVRAGRSLDDEAPVEAEPTAENADQLESRLRFIEQELLDGG